ncbi:non-ribosomal peptide synthetase [Ktedonospora formicarum]|uniref:Carrier domain-containing protein n=1 Tax=Ktedonospora formicarum TaxID=2778364 RepID=A0A8J3I7V3_9CHLR|nr:non-ribosomal peptide synthetase [Ktedonospora formicarum]GHO46314.1 hypothetical protein KSX_44770 [Ktedonospora formicarum]
MSTVRKSAQEKRLANSYKSDEYPSTSTLSKEEYQQVVIQWNDTAKKFPHTQSLHQLIEEQVARTPDAPALTFEQKTLTYRELNERANQLAHHLRTLGVGTETLVGVYMERSIEMVVALLGILKAGGAYVPLDPTYPDERIAFMLADITQSQHGLQVLTQAHLAPRLEAEGCHLLCLDTEWESIARHEREDLIDLIEPQNAAYVIYTSGSTGQPKGVINTHQGICNRLQWMQDAYQLTAQDCVLQKTPFSFDVSVWEFFWPLMTGARLVVARPEGHKDSAYLIKLIQQESITTLHFVPSMLQVFVAEPDLEQCDSLRQVICSGEALPFELQESFFARHQAALHNLYGPTEAAIDVTYWECQRQSKRHIVPIGYPIANIRIYILNSDGQPVPVGEQGELYIGGIGVARGYLNREELTAERFIPDPFSEDPQARLYRTGDLARYAPGGEIEYLGRIDSQVKLRGFRIELGEVEATIGHYTATREVAVIVREDVPGDKRLVAYIVWRNEQSGSISDLQAYLLRHVPSYMVPSTFVEMEQLPLSPNGKIDRRALPSPDTSTRANLSTEFVAPQTPTEHTLADVWSQVLNIKHIGVNDDFFALGGHSLSATQVISQLYATLGIRLPLRALFEAPTIAQLAAYIEHGLEREEEALPPLHPRQQVNKTASEQVVPASFAQQRLWFMDQLTPGNTGYNIPAMMRFTGKLNIEALRASLQALQQRQESLRTRFTLANDELYQIIAAEADLPLEIIDLSDGPEVERETLALHQISERATYPFDLARGPLWQVTVYQLTSNLHMLALVMHHIISDGWSIGIFFDEFQRLYTAFDSNQQPELTTLPVQYADFALWQRETLSEARIQKDLAYWKRQLADAPGTLELPTDRPRPAHPTVRGATHIFTMSKELSEAVRTFSRQEGVTSYITLITAFQLLLHHYTGQEDIVLGSSIADRQLPEVREVMGLFLNTLALRTNFVGNPTLRELLKNVRDTMLDAHAHQALPFERLARELRIERTAGQNALFQVALQLDPPSTPSVGPWSLTRMATSTGGSKFDLSLELDEQPDAFIGHLEYSTDLFDEATIVRMAQHWLRLLESMVANPEQAVESLPMLTDKELQQILVDWNHTEMDYPRNAGVHTLFEQQVERTPEAIAVTFETISLTYRELNERANQLARHLRTLGIERDELVGLCLERSLDMVVALLAILKAGGAYLPLDPTYPSERIAFMLEDAQVPVLLTEQALASSLPAPTRHTVLIDNDHEQIATYSNENLHLAIDGEQLAYVIYTSGSTGKPKGVQIPQRALLNFLLSMRQQPGLNSQDNLLAVTTLSFDIAGLELYLPLLVGARLILASRDVATNGSALASLLLSEQISVMQATPITWRLLLATGWTGNPDLKALCGGEALSLDLAHQLRTRVKALYNMYGPTETTIWSTLSQISSEEERITVGHPIANTSLFVLDAFKNPVPVGVSGELYIGGDGLARGYLRRPELTAERFPLVNIQGKEIRLYRTGDLARWQNDGTLELIGRVDHQVKLRGYRIELGEIENVLARHPSVQQAVTIVREDTPGDQRLVAYLLPKASKSPEVNQLRELARAALPAYMVPSMFVTLDKLPQTPNGKVDRRALPIPDVTTQASQNNYVAPRDATEQSFANIWSQVLGIERVGIYDDFFALGGHSLLAMQVAARVRTALEIDLPLRQFFEHPTIAQLTACLAEIQNVSKEEQMPAFHLTPRQQLGDGSIHLPASYAQRGLWLIDQLDNNTTAYNLQATMRLHESLDIPALQKSLDTLVERHEALRTAFSAPDGEPIQVISPARSLSIQEEFLADLPVEKREAEAHRLMTREVQRPFDLQQGPLFRATLLHLGTQEHILLLTMHHIISDGWSLGLLLREAATLYEGFVKGETLRLSDVQAQMGDFAAWQHQWLTEAVLEEQLSYWKGALEGAPTLLELPTDRPRPAVPSHRGALHHFRLPASLSAHLKDLSQREHVSLYMTLTTAFLLLLERYSGQQDLLLGTTAAGRSVPQTDTMVGYSINTLVLRGNLSGNPTVRELLARVRENVLSTHAYQYMPFDRLVQELHPDRSSGQSPLFQVFLTLDPPMEENTCRWDLTQTNMPTGSAMFDLTLELAEHPENIEALLEYSTDLFDASTIERMAAHWERLLESMVANPEQPIESLPMLTDQELQHLLVDWNATDAPYPREATIQQLFEQQVERTPDAIALIDTDGSMTFNELNGRANQLAHFLLSQGLEQEAHIGVALERSRAQVITLLGILKAGGTYVPLDPAYPRERLRFMLEDAHIHLVLTQEKHLDALPLADAHAFCLDREAEILTQQPQENPLARTTGDSIAYLLYTSGSTGRPKGVLGTHRGALNRFQWMWNRFPFAPDEVCAQKTTLNFVDAVWETFGPLLQGVRIVLVPDDTLKDPQRFLDLLARECVTRLVLVPSLLRVLLESEPDLQARVPLLRHWICSGETLPLDLAQRFQTAMPQSRLLNLYGSSEVAADATCYELPPHAQQVLIGRPIANMHAYLLDAQRRPVPVGVPGELYIGGDGVARGYFERDELTRTVFLTDPLHPDSARRFFKTGDWARYLPDGNLEYLGRVDQQVKLRGMRLELGEVEAILNAHEAVREAVAIVREERLIAYVAPAKDQQVASEALRKHLSASLPAYMVPSLFVTLEKLPQTPNGKIDRRALPVPDATAQAHQESYVAPRSTTEQKLVDIWSQVLGVERVGIYDDFFALGGHSLLAMQVAARIRNTLQVEAPLRVFFERPTIASLAEYAVKDQANSDTLPELQPTERLLQPNQAIHLPTTFAQRGLWFLHQLDESNTSYNLHFTLRLRESLDIPALQKSLDTLVERHEALRTAFSAPDGEPIQVISPARSLSIQEAHLADLPVEKREAEAHHLMTREVQRPFDLQQGPLFRATLLHLGTQEHLLLLTMHHIISDGWSTNLLLREFTTLYEGFVKGETPILSTVQAQMGDFAAWQHQWLTEAVLEEQLSYWKGALEGAPTLLELPTDRPRPAVPSHRGALHHFRLPASLSAHLKDLSQREHVSLYMTLTTAFLLLLERYSGQQDLLLGTTAAGRSVPQTDTMVGYSINTLVLRGNLSGNPTVRELLARVRENVLSTHAHQYMPFDRLVQELHPDRSSGQSPLFQVMITLDPPASTLTTSWDLTQESIPTGSAMFDLTLELAEHPENIEALLEYSTDLFDASTIERMAAHWERLLESMVANPEQPIESLPMLTDQELQHLLVDWNATDAPYPREATIQQLFEQQVERTPDAIALIDTDGSMTFNELNGRANQLAHFLLSQGLEQEAHIGVALERSRAQVITLLGILKAGGTYVPLDPAYPRERLRFMLEDAHIHLVLTQEKHLDALPLADAHAFCLDREAEILTQQPQENPLARTTGDSIAYLLYTSGSTGRPKGVLGTHRGALNRFQWMWNRFPFAPDEVCAQKTTLNFVDAVWETFGPLLQGVRIVLVPDDTLKDPQRFLDLLAREHVTRLVLVPSLLRVLLESEPDLQARVPLLRHWICSGETLPLDLAQRFQTAMPQSRLLNLYGSSEVAADATCYELPPHAQQVLIGRPIANMHAYLLDAQRRPVPVGVPGELYIGGDGVARGYFERDELTRTVFLTDPLHPDSARRFFKTGDWARYLPDGNLEYLGRVDQQVKLRGMRLELGEVEAILNAHEAVREAVAIVREERLIAYVAPAKDQQVASEALRKHLSASLPAYMVPSLFVTLEKLPQTPNGKVDRRALPTPNSEREAEQNNYVAPETLLQRQLVNIWEEVLDTRPIGIRDDFFTLGGHSLLAARMMTQVKSVSGKDLHLSMLFKGATIERLTENILLDQPEDTRTPVIAVQASGSKRPFFFLHGDWNGKAFYTLKLSQALGPDRPFYLLEPYSYTGLDVIPTLEEVAAAHIVAMRNIQPQGPYLLGGWCNGALIAYEMARQLQDAGQEVENLIMMDPGSAPTFSSWLRKGMHTLSKGIPLNIRLQDRLFFRILHFYEYFRLYKEHQTLLKMEREMQGERDPEEIDLPHPNFQWLFPSIEKLHTNYSSIFNWLSANYMVRPRQGKIAVFWAKELPVSRRIFWDQQLANRPDIEVYEVEGNHLTSRTRHIHVLANALRTCINKLE